MEKHNGTFTSYEIQMGRKRQHKNNAARQKAYRERLKPAEEAYKRARREDWRLDLRHELRKLLGWWRAMHPNVGWKELCSELSEFKMDLMVEEYRKTPEQQADDERYEINELRRELGWRPKCNPAEAGEVIVELQSLLSKK